jgi:hypothetical protein
MTTRAQTKLATEIIHTELVRVGAREILVEISEWSGDDGETRQTAKIQVWNLANHKDYAIWLPLDALPTLTEMLDRAMEKVGPLAD